MTKADLLTTGQIANALGVHRTTVDYWANTGKLPVALIANGIRLFDREAVDALVAERAAGAAS